MLTVELGESFCFYFILAATFNPDEFVCSLHKCLWVTRDILSVGLSNQCKQNHFHSPDATITKSLNYRGWVLPFPAPLPQIKRRRVWKNVLQMSCLRENDRAGLEAEGGNHCVSDPKFALGWTFKRLRTKILDHLIWFPVFPQAAELFCITLYNFEKTYWNLTSVSLDVFRTKRKAYQVNFHKDWDFSSNQRNHKQLFLISI